MNDGAPLADRVADTRLALEIAAIRRLALALAKGLKHRDPLSQKVHHGKAVFLLIALAAAGGALLRRPFAKPRVDPLAAGTEGR